VNTLIEPGKAHQLGKEEVIGKTAMANLIAIFAIAIQLVRIENHQ
jgi:hypothetical protein